MMQTVLIATVAAGGLVGAYLSLALVVGPRGGHEGARALGDGERRGLS